MREPICTMVLRRPGHPLAKHGSVVVELCVNEHGQYVGRLEGEPVPLTESEQTRAPHVVQLWRAELEIARGM